MLLSGEVKCSQGSAHTGSKQKKRWQLTLAEMRPHQCITACRATPLTKVQNHWESPGVDEDFVVACHIPQMQQRALRPLPQRMLPCYLDPHRALAYGRGVTSPWRRCAGISTSVTSKEPPRAGVAQPNALWPHNVTNHAKRIRPGCGSLGIRVHTSYGLRPVQTTWATEVSHVSCCPWVAAHNIMQLWLFNHWCQQR